MLPLLDAVQSGQSGHARGLAGAVALVTGSTSGIGLAIAEAMAGHGATVVVSARGSVEEGSRLADRLGHRATYLQADLGDEAQAAGLASRVVERYGHIDVVVNNAATTVVIPHRDLPSATADVWRRLWQVNVVAPWLIISAAEPFLRARRGCVVNVTSLAGDRPLGSCVPYAATKAALNHVTRLLAVALAPDIRVNAVAPGFIQTPWSAGDGFAEMRTMLRTRAPLGRLGEPEEVAGMVVALARSPYTTGQIVTVDGGLGLV